MKKQRIFIVDDNILLTQTIDMCLSKRGHDVKVFYSGADAVRCLFEERPDLLVLDVRLPDCDGWFLAKLLKKLEWAERVPLIVISALEPDRGKVVEVKPYAYIKKPFDMGQLMQTVEMSLSEARYLAGA